MVLAILLLNCFLRLLDAVLHCSSQRVALVEGLVESRLGTVSLGCLRRVEVRRDLNAKLHVLEIGDLLQILRRLLDLIG